MKVGDYIRDKRGMIAKIKKFWIYHNVTFIITDKDTISESMVVKSCPNIIDLIEVGDYVNGFRVEDVYNPEGTYVLWLTLSCNPIDRWKNEDIKSIVTKEQFESMKYKLGEDK